MRESWTTSNEKDIQETEKSEQEGTTPLPMYIGEVDMAVYAELENNNIVVRTQRYST